MENLNNKKERKLKKKAYSEDYIRFLETKLDYEKAKWEELKKRVTFKPIELEKKEALLSKDK